MGRKKNVQRDIGIDEFHAAHSLLMLKYGMDYKLFLKFMKESEISEPNNPPDDLQTYSIATTSTSQLQEHHSYAKSRTNSAQKPQKRKKRAPDVCSVYDPNTKESYIYRIHEEVVWPKPQNSVEDYYEMVSKLYDEEPLDLSGGSQNDHSWRETNTADLKDTNVHLPKNIVIKIDDINNLAIIQDIKYAKKKTLKFKTNPNGIVANRIVEIIENGDEESEMNISQKQRGNSSQIANQAGNEVGHKNSPKSNEIYTLERTLENGKLYKITTIDS